MSVLCILKSLEGRPVSISENDFDTALPELDPEEEEEGWQPATCDPVQMVCDPVPARVMSCFQASASLCEYICHILANNTHAALLTSLYCGRYRDTDLPCKMLGTHSADEVSGRLGESPGSMVYRFVR